MNDADTEGRDVSVHLAPEALPQPPRVRDFTKLPLLFIAAMFVAGAVLWPSLPATIPTHWGVSGRPDAFAPRGFSSVFMVPAIALATYALLVAVPFVDPKRRSLMRSIAAYNVVLDLVTGLLAVVYAASMIAAFRPGFDVTRIVLLGTAVLFAVIGNYMTTVKQNWTFGVRTSWTLADEVVWRKSNRLGGYLFVAAGVITAIAAWLPAPFGFAILMTTVIAMVVAMYVYSYLVFRSRHPEA